MKRIESIFQLREFVEDYEELRRISRKLQRYNELLCERSLTKREWKRKEELEKRAKEIAKKWGLTVDIQQDPRILPLYLTDENIFYRQQGVPVFFERK